MRSELPPELSLRGERAEPPVVDGPGPADEWDDPEVHVDRPAAGGPPPAEPDDRRDRRLYLACAVVGALALVVLAWSSWSTSQATRQQACLSGAQMMSWTVDDPDFGAQSQVLRDALVGCGYDVPEVEEGDAGSDEP